MSLTLYITDDAPGGAEEKVDLNGVDADVIDYIPYSPRVNDQDTAVIGQDGADQAAADLGNVWEPAEVWFKGNYDAAEATARRLTRLFHRARQHSLDGVGQPIRVYFRANSGKPLARAKLMMGRVFINERTFTHDHGQSSKNPRVRGRVIFKRDPVWELERTAVPLSNRNGSNNTSGLGIATHHDGSNDNFVDIAAASVVGGWPAAAEVEIYNTFDSSNRTNRIYLAHNWRSSPAAFSHILQGQAAAGGTSESSASASGGAYRRREWSGTAETNLFEWTLPMALLNAAQGNYFRIMAWLLSNSSATDLEIQWRVRIASLTSLFETDWVPLATGRRLIESLSVQLPPRTVGAAVDHYPLSLALYGRRLGGASTTINLDFVQLSPLDSWRAYRSTAFQLAHNARLVDDGIEGHLYTIGWSGAANGRLPNYVAGGEAVQLFPGRDQRLYFLMSGNTSDSIDRTAQVRVWYRPRTITL
jgi:hypothetical protein